MTGAIKVIPLYTVETGPSHGTTQNIPQRWNTAVLTLPWTCLLIMFCTNAILLAVFYFFTGLQNLYTCLFLLVV